MVIFVMGMIEEVIYIVLAHRMEDNNYRSIETHFQSVSVKSVFNLPADGDVSRNFFLINESQKY